MPTTDRTVRLAIDALRDLAFPDIRPFDADAAAGTVGVWEAEDVVAAAAAAEPLWARHPDGTVVVETMSSTEADAARQLVALEHALGQPDGWVCTYAKTKPHDYSNETLWLAQTQWIQPFVYGRHPTASGPAR